MSQYQRVEYRIGQDGQIVETVLEGSGPGCVDGTAAIESALGEVIEREHLPEYYADLDPAETLLRQQTAR